MWLQLVVESRSQLVHNFFGSRIMRICFYKCKAAQRGARQPWVLCVCRVWLPFKVSWGCSWFYTVTRAKFEKGVSDLESTNVYFISKFYS